MKKKFFFTGMVMIVCFLVLLYVNSKPTSMNMRFQGVSYVDTPDSTEKSDDTEAEDRIMITINGDLHEKFFTNDIFSGTLAIQSANFTDQYRITLNFRKNKSGEYILANDKMELGILQTTKDFKTLAIKITNPALAAANTYIAAPATDIDEAKAVTKKLFS